MQQDQRKIHHCLWSLCLVYWCCHAPPPQTGAAPPAGPAHLQCPRSKSGCCVIGLHNVDPSMHCLICAPDFVCLAFCFQFISSPLASQCDTSFSMCLERHKLLLRRPYPLSWARTVWYQVVVPGHVGSLFRQVDPRNLCLIPSHSLPSEANKLRGMLRFTSRGIDEILGMRGKKANTRNKNPDLLCSTAKGACRWMLAVARANARNANTLPQHRD